MSDGIVRAHSKVSTIGDATIKAVVAALKTDGRQTLASSIFGKHPEFKGPETVPSIGAAVKDRITLKQAEASGMMKRAKPCGWGIYNVNELDGGLGSIWYLEAAEDGTQYLVKQTDPAGEIVRRVKAQKAASVAKKADDAKKYPAPLTAEDMCKCSHQRDEHNGKDGFGKCRGCECPSFEEAAG